MWKRCKSTSKRPMLRPSTSPTVKQTDRSATMINLLSTVQLMPGDMVLKKADAFQGKRKVKDHWSDVEYEVVCQVTNGVPSYEIKDSSGNVKVAHHNQLFLLATPQGEAMPCAKVKMPTSVCLPGLP